MTRRDDDSAARGAGGETAEISEMRDVRGSSDFLRVETSNNSRYLTLTSSATPGSVTSISVEDALIGSDRIVLLSVSLTAHVRDGVSARAGATDFCFAIFSSSRVITSSGNMPARWHREHA